MRRVSMTAYGGGRRSDIQRTKLCLERSLWLSPKIEGGQWDSNRFSSIIRRGSHPINHANRQRTNSLGTVLHVSCGPPSCWRCPFGKINWHLNWRSIRDLPVNIGCRIDIKFYYFYFNNFFYFYYFISYLWISYVIEKKNLTIINLV